MDGAIPLPAAVAAIRSSWSADTCDPVDLADWSPQNPARGQCAVSSLVLNDILGGELLLADVEFATGGKQGVHYWNRLPDGTELDLTREQFVDGEVIGPAASVQIPPFDQRGGARLAAQYQLLLGRVAAALSVTFPRAAA